MKKLARPAAAMALLATSLGVSGCGENGVPSHSVGELSGLGTALVVAAIADELGASGLATAAVAVVAGGIAYVAGESVEAVCLYDKDGALIAARFNGEIHTEARVLEHIQCKPQALTQAQADQILGQWGGVESGNIAVRQTPTAAPRPQIRTGGNGARRIRNGAPSVQSLRM